MTEFQTPAWVPDTVFYQIFPDRFAQSARVTKPGNLEAWDASPTFHGFKGGDLLGVVERLDYLQDLGITGLYFTPVFQSAANHRYHTHDYLQVDPLLGGNAALRELLDAAHARGMRVVLDGVFNHSGRGFFPFSHILENGKQSPYLDWFQVHSFPLYAYEPENAQPGYAAWWNLKALPKLNTANPEVRQYLLGVARHWLEFGTDGWRLDVPGEIDDDGFWREFRRVCKGANSESYLVGEVWADAGRWLKGDMFDGVMNYPLTKACIEFFVGTNGDAELWKGGYGDVRPTDAPGFAKRLQALVERDDPKQPYRQLNLIDSHDTARLVSIARDDDSALRLATLFQMTYPGAPCVYYGDEIGMRGARDPDCRRGMLWDEHRWDHDMLAHFKRCIALRRTQEALRGGAMKVLHAEVMTIAYARYTADEFLLVALNAGNLPLTCDVPLHGLLADGDMLQDPWSSSQQSVSGGMVHDLKLAPRSGMVLKRVTV